MNWFPQIGQGSVTQFPFSRARAWRMIRNELESGERITLPDTGAGSVEWNLRYSDLSDDEAGRLQSLFTASQGSYGAFAFADPQANLLGWSEDLSQPDWQLGLLAATAGADDPNGKQRAWTLTNGSPGDQSLIQTVSLPGEYVTCFSAWLRSGSPFATALQRDGFQTTATVGPVWKRFYISGVGTNGAASSRYSIVAPAGRSLDVWGLQVEAQPYPSQYKKSLAAAGIYEETWFAADELALADTAPGFHSCEIKLTSRI